MDKRIYIDTNIVVDLCDSARACHEVSTSTVMAYLEQGNDLFCNSDTLSNLFYILSNRSTLQCAEVLEKMAYITQIVALVLITSEEVHDALALCKNPTTDFYDYEDALQYVCAKKIGASTIVTNDRGFISPDIPIQKTC